MEAEPFAKEWESKQASFAVASAIRSVGFKRVGHDISYLGNFDQMIVHGVMTWDEILSVPT